MINWIKGIFCNKEEVPAYEPEPKQWRVGKNISEPIISFVKCVQENPKRFKVTYEYDYTHLRLVCMDNPVVSELPESYYYTFKDLQTSESWTLYSGAWVPVFVTRLDHEGEHTVNPEWLTQDERVYLITSIKTIFSNRKGRKERVAQLRKERRIRDERNRLKGVYCND